MNEKNKVRLWTMPFIMLIIVNVFNATAGQMTFPLVADFAMSLGAKLTVASSIAGLMSLAALFVCPVAGVISDYLPKKVILSVSSVCYAVFLFLHAFCTSIPMLIFLRLVTGIFFSIINVTVVAYSSGFIAKERLGEGLGYAGLANILAQALGPAVSLSLEKTFGFYSVFYAAGACALAAFLLLFAMPKANEVQNEARPKKKLTLNSIFAWDYTIFMLLAVLFAACSSMILTYLKIIADERNIAGIALFFTVYSAAMVVMRPFTGKFMDKFGVYKIVIPAIILGSVSIVMIGFAYSLPMMIAASILMAFGQGAGTPSLQAHTIKKLDKSQSGVATSTIQIGMNIGHAFSPMIGSFFVTSFGYEAMLSGVGAILLVFGLLLLLLQYIKEKKKAK